MKRSIGPIILVLAVVALVGAAAWRVATDRGAHATLELAGRVWADEIDVSVPLVRSDAPTMPPTPGQPAVAGRLTSVAVHIGDHVEAGELIATLSTAPADAALALARAQAAEASATVALLQEKSDEAASGKSDLAAKRRELQGTLADLRARRATVVANLEQARALVKSLPSMPPSMSVPPTGTPGPDPRAIVAQLEAALAQLDAGIAKVETGLAKLDDARATINDAIVVLGDAKDAAGYAATAARAGVTLAQARRALTDVRAPVAGVLTRVTPAGSVVYAGAPFARLRPDADTLVEAYVTSSDAALLGIGQSVVVSADNLSAGLRGTVVQIASEYVYPPTMQATSDTHMVRGIRVRVRVDGDGLPAGMPVDIIVSTGR